MKLVLAVAVGVLAVSTGRQTFAGKAHMPVVANTLQGRRRPDRISPSQLCHRSHCRDGLDQFVRRARIIRRLTHLRCKSAM